MERGVLALAATSVVAALAPSGATAKTGKTTGSCEGTFPDTDCDEFPYHPTAQGGRPAVPLPHLRVISASANRSQGGSYGAFGTACGIPEGGEFLVVPSTVLPTSSRLCSAG